MACDYASGAIVGSLFIKYLASESSPRAAVERLLASRTLIMM